MLRFNLFSWKNFTASFHFLAIFVEIFTWTNFHALALFIFLHLQVLKFQNIMAIKKISLLVQNFAGRNFLGLNFRQRDWPKLDFVGKNVPERPKIQEIAKVSTNKAMLCIHWCSNVPKILVNFFLSGNISFENISLPVRILPRSHRFRHPVFHVPWAYFRRRLFDETWGAHAVKGKRIRAILRHCMFVIWHRVDIWVLPFQALYIYIFSLTWVCPITII